jgi:hypothetical protein
MLNGGNKPVARYAGAMTNDRRLAVLLLMTSLSLLPLGAQGPTKEEIERWRAQGAAEQVRRAADQAIVDRFFPQNLVNPDHPEDKRNCFGVYERAGDGSPLTIIAVYPDAQHEVLAVRRQSNGQYTSTEIAPEGFDFALARCSVEFIDVDGDGRNEVEVLLSGAHAGDADFLFRWDGSQLISIGPTWKTKWGINPSLGNAWFCNLYSDGTLAAVSIDGSSGEEDAPVYGSIYRLKDGQYSFVTRSAFALPFRRGKQAPEEESRTFTLFSESTGPYVLRVGNGDIDGKNRLTSGHISINGEELVDSSRLSRQTGELAVPIAKLAPGTNKITVLLDGEPGGDIQVVVEDHTPNFAQQ